jgi:hypothetical protein
MRKLKLESLQVESFDTTSFAPDARGTVEGRADAAPDTRNTGPSYCVLCYAPTYDPNTCHESYDPATCPYTEFMDCTYGCTRLYNTCGGNYCWIERTADCTV